MNKKMLLLILTFIMSINLLPVSAQNITAPDVLNQVKEVNVENYFNLNNLTEFKVENIEERMNYMYKFSTQFNWSDNPSFKIISII